MLIMPIYSALEMTVCELWIVECASGDADDVIPIYSVLDVTGSELCIVECSREWSC
jgi:hypothetical protein